VAVAVQVMVAVAVGVAVLVGVAVGVGEAVGAWVAVAVWGGGEGVRAGGTTAVVGLGGGEGTAGVPRISDRRTRTMSLTSWRAVTSSTGGSAPPNADSLTKTRAPKVSTHTEPIRDTPRTKVSHGCPRARRPALGRVFRSIKPHPPARLAPCFHYLRRPKLATIGGLYQVLKGRRAARSCDGPAPPVYSSLHAPP
jgi:hypothetical protein